MDIDKILCDIISHELNLNPDYVVVYNQNWNPPKTEGLYIVIATRTSNIVGVKNEFDNITNEEINSVTMYTNLDIIITSRNREAMQRKEEVVMALTSNYSKNIQEQFQVIIFRTKQILDLSFIEAGSALHRFQVPVIVSNLKEKRTSTEYYDKFSYQEVVQ